MAIQHLRSGTAHKRPVPGNMAQGQLGLNTNTASPGLYFRDNNGGLIKAGPAHIGTVAPNAVSAEGGHPGNSIGELWLDTTNGDYSLKAWDGLAWREQVVTSGMLKDSLVLTGIPTAPTAAPGTNTTQLATTAFVAVVQAQLEQAITANASSFATTIALS